MATRELTNRNPPHDLFALFGNTSHPQRPTARAPVEATRAEAPAARRGASRPFFRPPPREEIDRWVHPELGLGL